MEKTTIRSDLPAVLLESTPLLLRSLTPQEKVLSHQDALYFCRHHNVLVQQNMTNGKAAELSNQAQLAPRVLYLSAQSQSRRASQSSQSQPFSGT